MVIARCQVGEQDQTACSRLIDRRLPVMRPTDEYGERRGRLRCERLLVRGALLLVTAVVIGALAGWTKRVGAADDVVAPPTRVSSCAQMGTLEEQLRAARGELAAGAGSSSSAPTPSWPTRPSTRSRPTWPRTSTTSRSSEGIDPALGFQLVKIESSFKAHRPLLHGRVRLHPAPAARRRGSTIRT